jgi:NTP pyrophosphatase (non-canonical NTP hydrolase)
MAEILELSTLIADFANRRDWDVFHTPKNLAMAITGEAGELAAEFQWLTPEEAKAISGEKMQNVESEIADVAIYLLRLCDVLKIDLNSAIRAKMAINETRFPTSI